MVPAVVWERVLGPLPVRRERRERFVAGEVRWVVVVVVVVPAGAARRRENMVWSW